MAPEIRGMHIIKNHPDLLARSKPWVEIQLNEAPAVFQVDESPDFSFLMMKMVSTGVVWLIPSRQTHDGSGHTADPASTADAILRR